MITPHNRGMTPRRYCIAELLPEHGLALLDAEDNNLWQHRRMVQIGMLPSGITPGTTVALWPDNRIELVGSNRTLIDAALRSVIAIMVEVLEITPGAAA